MKLILSGGGGFPDSEQSDKKFVENLVNNKILYIPVAIDKKQHPYPECLNWIKTGFSKYGDFEITLGDKKLLKNISYDELTSYGGIFIGGGNTFYLLDFLKRSGFWGKLERLLKETDIPVEGGSAGAIIFCKSIDPVILYDPNEVGLEDLSGMNLIDGKYVWCHYDDSMKDLVEEHTKKLNADIIALPENCGIYVEDGKIEEIGDGWRWFRA